MRGREVVADGQWGGDLDDAADLEGVAEGLAHLLALDRDPRVVEPVPREAEPGRVRLGLLVLVVREAQVDPAAVDVEGVAEVAAGHGRALEVPARSTGAVRGGPGGGDRLVLLVALPQREVADVLLAARVGVLRRGAMSSGDWWLSEPYSGQDMTSK